MIWVYCTFLMSWRNSIVGRYSPTYSTLAPLGICNLWIESTCTWKPAGNYVLWKKALNSQNHLLLLPAPEVTQYVKFIHILSIFILLAKFFLCADSWFTFSHFDGFLKKFPLPKKTGRPTIWLLLSVYFYDVQWRTLAHFTVINMPVAQCYKKFGLYRSDGLI